MVLKKKDFCRIAQKHAKRTTEKFRVNFSVVLLNNSSGNPTATLWDHLLCLRQITI